MIEIAILAFIEFCAWSMTIFPTIGDELGTRSGDLVLINGNYTYKRVWFYNIAILAMASYWSYSGAEIRWLALVVMAATTALRFWAACELGEFYTSAIGARPDQHIVTTGPYHYFRHPSYLAQFIFTVFMIYLFVGWVGFIAIPFLALGHYRSFMAEDEMLYMTFGEEYTSYASNFML